MQAVKITEDGQILAEGRIVLRGRMLTTRQRTSYLYLEEAELVDMTTLSAEKNSIDAHLYDVFSSFGFGYSPISGTLTDAAIGDFVFSGAIYDTGFCVFELKLPGGDVFVVGSNHSSANWQDCLVKYLEDNAG